MSDITPGELFSKEILMMATHARSLFLSNCFFTANIWQLEAAKALVTKCSPQSHPTNQVVPVQLLRSSCTDARSLPLRRLVRLDRLPEYTSAQGLRLLRDAWCEVDVCSHLADYYKRLCKALFIIQISLAFLVVAMSAVSSDLELQQFVFVATVLLTAVISLQGMYNSRPRWRQLRNGANSLESLIWMYRTRVGRFEIDDRNSDRPERELEVIYL